MSVYDIFQIITGMFLIWVGVYIVTRDPSKLVSWLFFLLLFSFGVSIFTDSILARTNNLSQHILWMTVTDWILYFAPIFYFHISYVVVKNKPKYLKYLLYLGYLLALTFFILEIKGGIILNEEIVRSGANRIDTFAPGPLLILADVSGSLYILGAMLLYYFRLKDSRVIRNLVISSGAILLLSAATLGFAYYYYIPWGSIFFTTGFALGMGLYVIPLLKYHWQLPSNSIFDKTFYLRTLSIIILIGLYLGWYKILGIRTSFDWFSFLIFGTVLLLITHPLYEWLSTFLNDLIYNPSAGFSLVTDGEIYDVVKNYNNLGKLENSTLLRLNIISKKVKAGLLPLDALREMVAEAVEYFKPKEDGHPRIKNYLKYQLLKMIVFNEAEEGQILWELGFEEYPVRIMSQEGNSRPPLFRINSASDYSYTSRNAYLALKREAIHDVTWRISYLEKMSKRRTR